MGKDALGGFLFPIRIPTRFYFHPCIRVALRDIIHFVGNNIGLAGSQTNPGAEGEDDVL